MLKKFYKQYFDKNKNFDYKQFIEFSQKLYFVYDKGFMNHQNLYLEYRKII